MTAPMSSMAASRSLLDLLRRESILSVPALDEAERLEQEFPDSRSFLNSLVQRRLVTEFQVNFLQRGRVGELLIKHYVLLEPLGEGGMGKVYKRRVTAS